MKKLTVSSLAFGNLRARRKQYVLMIIGIIFAMVFSSGTMFLVSSIVSGVRDLEMRYTGKEDYIYFGIDDETINDGKSLGLIGEYTEGENLGYIFGEKEESGCYVAKLTPEAVDMTYTILSEGRYPEKKGEIAIEANAFMKLRSETKVGDKIKLNFLVQSGDDLMGETKEKTYTLTGIINDRSNNIEEQSGKDNFIPAAFVSSEEEIDAGGKSQRIVFAMTAGENSSKVWSEFYDSHNLSWGGNAIYVDCHTSAIAKDTSALMNRGYLIVLLAIVLMLVSCIGIINAFNSNLLERKKQIGLLRAVGTTRRQIINIFGREAFFITLICTPISVLISYFATRLVVSVAGGGMLFIPNFFILAIGTVFSVISVMLAALVPLSRISKISPMQAIRNIEMTRRLGKKKIKQKAQFNVPLLTAKRNLTFSRGRLAAISVILIVTILLSSFGISFVADEFKEEYIYKEPDYVVNVSSGYDNYYFNAFRKNADVPITANEINELLRIPYVKESSCRESRGVNLHYTEDNKYAKLYSYSFNGYMLTDEFQNTVLSNSNYADVIEALKNEDRKEYGISDSEAVKEKFGFNDEILGGLHNITSLDSKEILSLKDKVTEGRIDIDKINSGEEIVLTLPKNIQLIAELYSSSKTNNFVSFNIYYGTGEPKIYKQKNYKYIVVDSAEAPYHAGDELDLSFIDCYYKGTEGLDAGNEFEDSECMNKKVKIGAIISSETESPFISFSSYNNIGSFGIVTTHSGLRSMGVKNRISQIELYLKDKCTEEINDTIMSTINSLFSDKSYTYISSRYELEQYNENINRAMMIGLVSIVLLFMTVCANLVNNSITAAIRENKREIGTLRALGASLSDLTKSYIYQLLYMLGIGSGVGIGIFAVVAIGLKIYEKVMDSPFIVFTLNYYVPVLVCVALFAVCTANLYIQLRKITKTSIVDNIREL